MIYLLKGGYVISPEDKLDGCYDILVKDNHIKEIEKNIKIEDYRMYDDIIELNNKIITPGFVDAHCHLRTPGFEYKEDIESGSKSAAKGGFTSIACMPNTNPVLDNKAMIEFIINRAKEDAYCHVYPIGSITKNSAGKELSEIGELKFAGAVGISDDGNPVENPDIMMKALQYADMFDIAVISHCEVKEISDGDINEGIISTQNGLRGIPSAAEEIMVSRELILAQYLNLPVHIAHISTKLSVDLIRNAKKRGVKVTCETCPHFFSLTQDATLEYDTNAKVNPPLRTNEDKMAIIEGIKDGTIDIIATDHAPHHIDEKNVEFQNAANGMIGFETALSLAIDILHHKNNIPIKRIVQMMSVNPSKLLGLNKGTIEKGAIADLTIFDINKNIIIDKNKMYSKSKNTPFHGFKLKGDVTHTIVSGEIIMKDSVLR